MKTKRINVRIAEHEKEELTELSRKLDIPEAVIVRQAVKETIQKLRQGQITIGLKTAPTKQPA